MRRARKQIEINARVGSVFDLFSRFSNFPQWMRGVINVERTAPSRAHWIAVGPDGERVEWDSEVADLELNRLVTWHSIGGDIVADGDARFEETDGGATLLRLTLGYDESEPGFSLFADNLEQRLEDDLRRFKFLAEREAQAISQPQSPNVAPAMVLEARLPAIDQSSIHFEPLSQIRRSGHDLKPAQPLGRSEEADRPPAPSRIVVDRDETDDRPVVDDDQYFIAPRTSYVGGAPQSRQPVFKASMFILLLALALGVGWFLAGNGANNLNQRRANALPPSPAAEPSRKQPDAAATEQPTPAAEASPATAEAAPSVTPNAENANDAAEVEEAEAAKAREAVKSTLDGWIAATNEKNIDAQMNFYAPTLRRYYLRRSVSRDQVREDKTRVFAEADSVRINAGEPEIELEQAGSVARARFRKQYEIARGGETQSGEVLQELLLLRSGDQWLIIGERDLRVIE